MNSAQDCIYYTTIHDMKHGVKFFILVVVVVVHINKSPCMDEKTFY